MNRPRHVGGDTAWLPETLACCCIISRAVLGEVQYEKNGHKMSTLMHVDNTSAMWMFFDVHGSAQAIKLCGKWLTSLRTWPILMLICLDSVNTQVRCSRPIHVSPK